MGDFGEMEFERTSYHLPITTVVSVDELPRLNVSYKPQEISPKFQGTVRMMLHEKIRNAYVYPQFVTDVIKPLQVSLL
jgi:ATP-binding cassette subfamily E protein 1